ncbi:MAG: Crp/Fnr family transcriptional regulator [Anaerofustis stercorihominis]|nr:Crp/Fnr family transcriptional regulator [Anaerofustis stercorihominis]
MKKYFEVLTKCPLFEGIDTNILGDVLDCLGVEVRAVEKNQVILEEGEPANDVGIVLSGAVHMIRDDINGNRSIIMHIEPSELFAETFACAGVEVMPCSMIAATKGEVMFINCKRILTVCNNACEFHSRLIQNLLRIVASKNMSFDKKIDVTSQRSTKDKLMTYLLHEAKKAGSDEFTISYDRQTLADYLGVERSAMSAELSKLKSEGLIDYNKNWFKMLV